MANVSAGESSGQGERRAAPPSTAAGWEKWSEWNQRNMQPLVEWFATATELSPGKRLLDVACGAGLPSIPLASRVMPGGRVVAIDVSPEMVAITERRARQAGMSHMEVRAMDAQDLRFPDASFDAITFGFGLMFCPDPVKAAAELHRVLQPKGRFGIAVWTEAHRNPFFTTIFSTVGRFMPSPPPDPKAPGMFKLGPPGELERVLRAGGFTEVVVEECPLHMECGSVGQLFEIFSDMAPPVNAAVHTLPPAELARMRTVFAETIAPYMDGERVRLPATPLVARGRR